MPGGSASTPMTWRGFLTERVLRFVLLLPLVAFIAFALLTLSPIDPVRALVGADMLRVGPEQQSLIAEKWGLEAPFAERFLAWSGAVLSGDLGTSMIYGRPVLEILGERAPASLLLMLAAWSLAGLLGITFGCIIALKEGGWIAGVLRSATLVLAATPTFWAAMVLVSIFALGLGWLPACCAGPPGTPLGEVGLLEKLRHMILPITALSLPGIALVTLHTAEKLGVVLRDPMVDLPLSRGVSRRRIVLRHGLRNGAAPAVTLQGARLGELFGGTVLAETVFAYPGLGQATVRAGLDGDAPLLLGITLATAVMVFCGNLSADLAAMGLDPRQRPAPRTSRGAMP